jgi:dienelactone hydrolase
LSKAGGTLKARWRALKPFVRVIGPEGGRRPTVLMFHGCGGLGSQLDDYAAAATARGVRTVVVDSFSPRGWSDRFGKNFVCTGMVFRGAERAGDVLASTHGAVAELGADPGALVLAGWSHGGWAIMDLMTMPLQAPGEAGLADPSPQVLAGVKGLFLAYPYGGLTALSRSRDWVRRPRALAVLGEKDRVTHPRDAERIYDRIRAGGCELEVLRVAGAHAFDEQGSDLSWFRYRRELAAQSIEKFSVFLGETLAA